MTDPGRPSRFETVPRHVEKPWGWELIWAETDLYVGKLLFVRAGEALSLQYHEEKDESWLVREGRVRIDLGSPDGGLETIEVESGAAFHLPPRTVHRLTAVEDTLVLEVSTSHPGDVVRLDDRYGREGTSTP